MNRLSENHIWLSECGTLIIQKKFGDGAVWLSEWERLVYSVWYTDFMLRIVGGIDETRAAHRVLIDEAFTLASRLRLAVTAKTFRLSVAELNNEFNMRFEAVCDELRDAKKDLIQASISEANSETGSRDQRALPHPQTQ